MGRTPRGSKPTSVHTQSLFGEEGLAGCDGDDNHDDHDDDGDDDDDNDGGDDGSHQLKTTRIPRIATMILQTPGTSLPRH